jgi:hypothetical protein
MEIVNRSYLRRSGQLGLGIWGLRWLGSPASDADFLLVAAAGICIAICESWQGTGQVVAIVATTLVLEAGL